MLLKWSRSDPNGRGGNFCSPESFLYDFYLEEKNILSFLVVNPKLSPCLWKQCTGNIPRAALWRDLVFTEHFPMQNIRISQSISVVGEVRFTFTFIVALSLTSGLSWVVVCQFQSNFRVGEMLSEWEGLPTKLTKFPGIHTVERKTRPAICLLIWWRHFLSWASFFQDE